MAVAAPHLTVDLTRETGISAAQAARYFPGYRAGTKSHPSKIVRYIQAGVPHKGQRVKLAAVRVGGAWMTTVEAVRRFLAALQDEPTDTPAAEAVRPPSARRRASEQAASELERMGC